MTNLESDMQAVIDRFKEFKSPRVENLHFANARNAPTLKNAVEELAANSFSTRAINAATPVLPERVERVEHILIPTSSGEVLARVYTPGDDGPYPILVYFHGGGWVIANLDVYEPSCRALCNAAECIVVSVAYRQAPEAPYPAAVHDAFDATQWVIANASSIGGDQFRVAVGGESAGGNLAAVTCLIAKKEGRPMPTAQLLIYPVTDLVGQDYDSYKSNPDTLPLHTGMMAWFGKYYIPDENLRREYTASPLLTDDLSGLPPAIVITAEHDPLRDQGIAYATKLAAAGVSVNSQDYEGVTHEFFGLANAVAKAKEALTQASDGLKKAWGNSGDSATAARL